MTRTLLFLLAFTSNFACGGRVGDAADAAPGGSASNGGTNSSVFAGGSQSLPPGSATSGASGMAPVELLAITQQQYGDVLVNACDSLEIVGERWYSSFSWAIDTSSSMAQVAPAYGVSKWELTKTAVLDAIGGLYANGSCSSVVANSILVYPGWPTDGLTADPVRPGITCIDGTRQRGTSGTDMTPFSELLGSVTPIGGTPTLDAYRAAVGQRMMSSLSGSNFVVLVTDGMPTIDAGCTLPDPSSSTAQFWPLATNGDNAVASVEAIITEIDQARSAFGIFTLVVGSPGSEAARSWLSRAAVAGGTAQPHCDQTGGEPYCHLDMTSRLDAPSAIGEMTRVISPTRVTCSISLPPPIAGATPLDPRQVAPMIATYDGQYWFIPPNLGPAEDCLTGFRLVQTPDSMQIEFCPDTCVQLTSYCVSSLTIAIGCSANPHCCIL